MGDDDVMSIVRGWRAQPTGTDGVPRLTPIFDEEPPEYNGEDWEKYQATVYRNKAEEIAEALAASLPGGLLSALAVALMARYVNLLRVRMT